jgi:hypothetical protein
LNFSSGNIQYKPPIARGFFCGFGVVLLGLNLNATVLRAAVCGSVVSDRICFAITNGADAGMSNLAGVTALEFTHPQGTVSPVRGNGRTYTSFKGKPEGTSTGTLNMVFKDLNVDNGIRKTSIYARGVYDVTMFSLRCIEYANIAMITNQRAANQDGAEGWLVREYHSMRVEPTGATLSGLTVDGVPVNYVFDMDETTKELTGLTVSSTNYGVASASYQEYWSPYPVTMQTFIGDAAATTVTLDYTPAGDGASFSELYADGVALTYGAGAGSFTTALGVLTFGTAPAAGVTNVLRYQFIPTC